MTDYIIIAAVSYFIGCIHPSYIIGKLVGHFDIRSQGSNNAGASNVTFVLGWKWGVITAVVDVLKGLVTVFLVRYFTEDIVMVYLSYAFVVAGHIFPFYMGFRGGKGLATSMGAYGGITVPGTLILLAVLFGVTVITGYIGLATIIVSVLMFVRTVYVYGIDSPMAMINGVVTALVLARHAVNIRRMIKGEEISLWTTVKKHKKSADREEIGEAKDEKASDSEENA